MADQPQPSTPQGAECQIHDFLAALGHELRNRLAAISGALDLWRHPGSAAHLERIREVVERQAEHLSRIVDDPQDLARLGRGRLPLHRGPLEVHPLVNRAVAATAELMRKRQHEFSAVLPAEALWVDADAARLEQVLVHVLSNAARFTPDGGRIVLQAGGRDGHVVISVRDTGIGLPPEMLDQVFDVFARDASQSGEGRVGLGIGLTLARKFIELHGGTIEASSAGPNLGSTFTVRVPAIAAPAPAAAGAGETGAGVGASKIVVIDDDRALRHLARAVLRRQGHTVEVAASGPAGLTLIAQFQPDVVLCDVRLDAEMSGPDVARLIRRQAAGRPPLLLALSGFAIGELTSLIGPDLFDGALGKPLNVDELNAAIVRHRQRQSS